MPPCIDWYVVRFGRFLSKHSLGFDAGQFVRSELWRCIGGCCWCAVGGPGRQDANAMEPEGDNWPLMPPDSQLLEPV